MDAYARNLDDLLQELDGNGTGSPLECGFEDMERYVEGLYSRVPRTQGRGGDNVIRIGGTKLSSATIRQRIVTVRLFFEFCILRGFREDPRNPVARGVGAYAKGGRRRGIAPLQQSQPWIPSDETWERIVAHVLHHESLRNQAMVLLAYEGALRRQELIGLHVEDVDFGAGLLFVRPELSKTGMRRTVTFSAATATLLARYIAGDRSHLICCFGREEEKALFVSESNRNPGAPLSIGAFNDVVARIRRAVGVPQLKPHTLRHLRCTVLRRCGVDLQDIALYAGHASVRSTELYVHLAPGLLAQRVRDALAPYNRRMERLISEASCEREEEDET